MTQVCGKRRDPQRDLSKEIVEQGEDAGDEMPANDLKEADPETLKSRQRLRIVRSVLPPVAEPQDRETKESVGEKDNAVKAGEESSENVKDSKDDSTQKSDVKESTSDEKAPKDEGVKETTTNGDTKPLNGLGLFSSHFNKDSTLFVSPFTSLAKDTGSFFLNTSTNTSAVEESNNDDDVPPAEEMTIINTTVDENEESIFSEKDCRMQKFDHATKSWVPKPPLDGKVEIIAPKEGEDKKDARRIVFYVNRTGKLQLNTPILPTSVGFRHPQNRAVCVPGEGKEKAGDMECVKKNTLEFIGLKMDAKDMKDTTFYRVRFPSDEKCAEFLKVVDQ